MENPFSAVAIAATAEVIVDTKEQVSYQTTKMQREIILTKLKEKGCRITWTKALDILTTLILGIAPEIIPFIALWQVNIHRRSCLPYIRDRKSVV